MSRRSTVEMLPDNILKALEHRIYSSRFSEYQKHSEWLKKLGHDISKSAVHRYGKKLAQIANSKDEIELLNIFRQLAPASRQSVLDFAKYQLSKQEKKAEIETRQSTTRKVA